MYGKCRKGAYGIVPIYGRRKGMKEYGKCRKGAYGIVPIYGRRKGMKERKPSGCRKEDLTL